MGIDFPIPSPIGTFPFGFDPTALCTKKCDSQHMTYAGLIGCDGPTPGVPPGIGNKKPDCLFESCYNVQSNDPSTPDVLIPIDSEDAVLRKCKKLKDGTCKVVGLDGHGSWHLGISFNPSDLGSIQCQSSNGMVESVSPGFDPIFKCLGKLVAPGGYILVSSCTDEDAAKLLPCLQRAAESSGQKVCACVGSCTAGQKDRFAGCAGGWICAEPNHNK